MKNKGILITLVVIVLAVIIGLVVYNFIGAKPITANLNEEFALNKNQIAVISDGEDKITLTVTGFSNSPAPDGAAPIWPGVAVYYTLQVNDKEYKTSATGILPYDADLKYLVEIDDTDYETFAKFVITKIAEPITANLNEEFTLSKNQVATLTNGEDNIKLTVTDLINSPAPESAAPIWLGVAVNYTLQVNSDVYQTSATGVLTDDDNLIYKVEILDTDYITYAKFKITLKEVQIQKMVE